MLDKNTFTVNSTAFRFNSNDNDRYAIDLSGKRIVPILDVAIGLERKNISARLDAITNNVAVKNVDGSIYIGRVWPGYSLFPDFEKQSTRAFWNNYTANFMRQFNISAFWLDMNEFANFCHGICEGKRQTGSLLYVSLTSFE